MLRSFLAAFAIGSLAATPVAAQDARPPEPINTPGLSKELQAIDDVLTGGLLNDPTTLDWENYGNERNLVVDETFPGGAALNVKQAQAGEVFTGGLNVPLVAAVDAGERVTVGFYARTLASDAEGGAGKLGVRFQLNQEPYPGFGDAVLDIGTEWKWYEVTAEANQAMRRNGIVALQTGLAAQTLQIGQAIVVSGTRSINE